MKDHKVVPEQVEGGQTGAREEASFATAEEARSAFQRARDRLLDVSHWKTYAGDTGGDFALCDAQGQPKQGPARLGDYIRIDLPAPGSASGEGYDWVQVELIEYEENTDMDRELLVMRVRPASAPGSEDEAVSHFYTAAATSTFLLQRTGDHLSAAEKGRNEVLNTEAETLRDKVRNVLVGSAAKVGLSIPQWSLILKGLLHD